LLLLVRVGAALLALTGAGFGISCVIGLRSLITTHEIAFIYGYPTYGRGHFERYGIPSNVPLLAGFLAVCALELVAAWLLWNGRVSGGVLALVLVPLGAVYWWGFDLPFPPVLVAVSTLLLLIGWRALA
jgi:hypothetical protein